MTEFTFYLSDQDADRLWALKQEAGETSLSGNEYAAQLLSWALRQLHPEQVQYDEAGRIIPRKKG